MSYFDSYKNRVNSNDSIDAFTKATIELINDSFATSSSYSVLNINNESVDVRVVSDSNSQLKRVLFRPEYGSKIQLGTILEIDGDKWLIIDVDRDKIYPKALIQYCNQNLKWYNSSDILIIEPCIVTAKSDLNSFDVSENKYISTLEGKYKVYVSNNINTQNLVVGHRFVFNSHTYEIKGIDSVTNSGVLSMIIEPTVSSSKDNKSTQVADNSIVYKKGDSNSNTSGGGSLW